ncbi:hypothetical protein ACJW31_06G056400 [Castanea mollissima]
MYSSPLCFLFVILLSLFPQHMANMPDLCLGCISCRVFPMDMFGSIVGNIIPSVGKHWNYHKEADQHVKNLKRKWEFLESRKHDIKTKLDSELRPKKKPKQEVKLWLQNVETVKGDIDIQEPAKWMFLSRMRKGESAFKKTEEVEELYQRGCFH